MLADEPLDGGPAVMGAGALLPRRQSLVAQTVEAVRARIRSGLWATLPSEREACRLLRVARNTLRKALAELEDEGLVAPGTRGRRRQVRADARTSRPGRGGKPERVVFLTAGALHHVQPATLLQIDLLREHLATAGLPLDVRTGRAFGVERPDGVLDRMVRGSRPSIWVLHHATGPIHAWFAREGVPAIVLGYPQPDVRLPYVTEDVRAAAVHAVGRLVAAGHRRVALLRSRAVLAGHRVAEEGMAAAAARHDAAGLELRNAFFGDNTGDVIAAIDALLADHHPPTAIITTSIPALVTLMTHLGRRGIAVPGAMSVISLFEDPVIAHIVPAVSHYRVNTDVLVRRLAEKVLAVREAGAATVRPSRIMCEWVPGATVAASRGV